MFPLNPSGLRTMSAGGIDHICRTVEIPDADVAEVSGFSMGDVVFPRLRPGDQVYLCSAGYGVHRRVVRVEPIAGGNVVVWLDPGYVSAGDARAIRSGSRSKETAVNASKIE
jgi:hypothetical protein